MFPLRHGKKIQALDTFASWKCFPSFSYTSFIFCLCMTAAGILSIDRWGSDWNGVSSKQRVDYCYIKWFGASSFFWNTIWVFWIFFLGFCRWRWWSGIKQDANTSRRVFFIVWRHKRSFEGTANKRKRGKKWCLPSSFSLSLLLWIQFPMRELFKTHLKGNVIRWDNITRPRLYLEYCLDSVCVIGFLIWHSHTDSQRSNTGEIKKKQTK